MRLLKFRIKNFRSIVDSGWNTLSSDNITALIGQNESGKTSVLEGLYSFWEGTISEDVLRSDMTFPEVSCCYRTGSAESFDFVDNGRLPGGVLPAIKKEKNLVLTREWLPDMSSRITLSGDEISEIFDEIEKKELSLAQTVLTSVVKALEESGETRQDIVRLEKSTSGFAKELEKIIRRQAELKKLLKRSSDPAKQAVLKQDTESVEKQIDCMAGKLQKESALLEKSRKNLNDRVIFHEHGNICLKTVKNLENLKPELDQAYRELKEVQANMAFLRGEKETRAGELKLFEAKENYIRVRRNMESFKEKAGVTIRLVKKLLEGKTLNEAKKEAANEFDERNKLYTREEAGEAFFKCIPPHEFFQDFSSLLPNRIDLEDIFQKNKKVEGYKAVKNFLIIAGLDPQFFRQTNNRILKQKIENLNNDVTVDFQEYWRQNIGKTNKIRIHFELEHYDTSHPEKKGRPYLEFWIKDEHERLYPKQRSRGVRWFLSFYLELKAFARQNENAERVFLIDEPGLSLHARAQEDVLKVFEDIKGKIQIIYTTHSPHLIDHDKLYRLLAVQRGMENHEQSETIIYDASHLHAATSDTLSPLCSLLGAGFNRQQLARQTSNVIVEDISSFYYISSLYKMINPKENIHFLPANGPAGVTILVNLLIGWGFDFSVLLFDNQNSQEVIGELQLNLKGFDPAEPGSRLIVAKNMATPEDLFSTLDFKRYILKKRIGIPDSNSGFINDNDIPRHLLASDFARSATSEGLSFDAFDHETRHNLRNIFASARFRTSDENC
jgi:predicted ATP-dependent endonuclease of OLD family